MNNNTLEQLMHDGWGDTFPTTIASINERLTRLEEKVFPTNGGNLFNISGVVDVNYTGQTQNLNSVSDGVLTCNANSSSNHAVGQLIDTEIGSVYKFSGTVSSFGTGSGAVACFYDYETSEGAIDKSITELGDFTFQFTARANKTLFGFATNGGTGSKFTNLKVIKV